MGNLFGKSKKPAPSRITDHDKAVLQLKKQRDKLKQYQKRIELSLVKERELAKKCLAMGRKERALLLLKKKRYQEKMLQNTDQQLENLERLASDIEYAQIELQVVDGLKVGNEALQNINSMLDIDEIERILDETKEGADKQAEINALLSSVVTEEDEEDIMRELDELVEAEEAEKAVHSTKVEEDEDIALPDVPTDEPEVDKEQKVKRKTPEKKVAVVAD